MGQSLNRMRARLTERNKASAPQQPTVAEIQINYGYADGKVIVSFNQPIQLLAMTPDQVRDMRAKLGESEAAMVKAGA